MEDIYLTLCNIIEEKKKLKTDKQIGVRFLNMPVGTFDLMKFYELDNIHFVEALYLGMLNRNIDDNAFKLWSNLTTLPKEDFQKQAIQAISNSDEFKLCPVNVKNNIYNKGNVFSEKVNTLENERNNINDISGKYLLKIALRKFLRKIYLYLKPLFNNKLGIKLKKFIKIYLS